MSNTWLDFINIEFINELVIYFIATDKRDIHTIFFLFLQKNIYCWYSLEVPQRGTSNKYPQYVFIDMKNISTFQLKTKSHIWSYGYM